MAKTPEQIAEDKPRKAKYTLYLSTAPMDDIQRMSTKLKISASKIVDEAIIAYIKELKENKK